MWSVDPQTYEAHKKLEKKGDKTKKNVRITEFEFLLHSKPDGVYGHCLWSCCVITLQFVLLESSARSVVLIR